MHFPEVLALKIAPNFLNKFILPEIIIVWIFISKMKKLKSEKRNAECQNITVAKA